MPSSFRKSSKREPVWGLRFAMSPLLKAFYCEFDFLAGGTLRLLDETVQQYHLPMRYGKQRARDAVIKRRAHFPDRSSQMVDAGFPDRPLELHISDILADRLPVRLGQSFQPVTYRLNAVLTTI